MTISGDFNSRCTPAYRVLSEDRIKRIHTATLELLETEGVRVMHSGGVEMLREAGCRVKPDNQVRIPNWLVEDAIRGAPSRVTIYNRLGREAMRLEGRECHFGMGTDLGKTWDLETGELRKSLLKDVANNARIGDFLDEIDFIGSNALPHDAPTNLTYIDSYKTQMENSVKPIFFTAAGLEDLRVIHEMTSAVMGGKERAREKPIHIHYSEPTTPLVHSVGAVDKLFYCADNAIPVTYIPGMMSGASAPVTLAGAITLGNAEALSGIVLHQLRAKGAPIISGFGTSTFDMRTSACIYGCPEYRLAISACADLYHYYGVPMLGTAGATDAHLPDQQAGMEWGVSLLTAGLDGANLIHDVGYLGQGFIGHPAALVMCAEIISYVKRMVRGFDIDAEHIGLDVIRRVGPGGEFLTTAQTMDFFQKEHWRPTNCNRDPLDAWQGKGSPTWGEAATRKAIEILDAHRPVHLLDDVAAALAEIRKKAETELENKHFEV